MTVDEVCDELSLEKATVYRLLADGNLTGHKVPIPRKRGSRWEVDPTSVTQEKRHRLTGGPREEPPPPRPLLLKLPDLGMAVRDGELDNLGPEAIAAWVRRKRAEALGASGDDRSDAPPEAPDALDGH